MQVITRSNARGFSNVRLVGEGTNDLVNILEAIRRAEEEGLDLCLISDKSNPPVVKIQDFKKIQYEAKKAKAKQPKGQDLKEIQLKVNITDHDLGTKVSQMKKFLERGDKVKVSVRLKGRERDNPERARLLMDKVIALVPAKISYVPGPITIALFEPDK